MALALGASAESSLFPISMFLIESRGFICLIWFKDIAYSCSACQYRDLQEVTIRSPHMHDCIGQAVMPDWYSTCPKVHFLPVRDEIQNFLFPPLHGLFLFWFHALISMQK